MTVSELPGWARELLEHSRVARLGFVDEADRPRVLPITFAVAEGAVWSAVDRKRKRGVDREIARLRFLRRNPAAALCVDRYEDDWEQLAWVQVLGTVTILNPDEGRAGLAALVHKYRPYQDQTPPGPLIRLDVARVLQWRAYG